MRILFGFFIQIFFIQISYSQLLDDVIQCLEGKSSYFEKSINSRLHKGGKFPGESKIDVNYYKLNLDIDVTYEYETGSPLVVKYLNKKVSGITTIKAKSIETGLLRAKIDLQNTLITDSVFVNNIKTTFTHAAAVIDIDLLKAYSSEEQFQLTIYYHGTPGSSGFGSFTFGTHTPPGMKQEPAVWSLSEPFGASDWFPCKDNPADKADSSDVWITAPKYFTSVSNGILEAKIEGATTNTYKWKSRYPIANYLISIALANYEYYKNDFNYGGANPMPVDHYVFPEYNTAANKLLMDDTIFMLDLFTQKFGPYPFLKEKYGHAMFGWGGGMEHQTISSMVNISSGLTAHELTHQWFGDQITCQDWANIWLNEGFATFGALIYWEAKTGVSTYKSQIISTMNSAKNAVGSVWVQNPTTVGQIFNGARSYSKGGIILHMLRNIVGDVKFYNILKAYSSSIHAYGNATTENFQAIVESVTGEDFNYFFQQWVYGEKYPKYEFGWAVFSNPGAKQNVAAGYTLKLNIKQLINTPTPSYFTMPIDLKITFADNSTEILRVTNNSQTQFYEFSYAKNITGVTFDPENGILKDLTLVPLNLPLSLEEPLIKILENEKLAKEIDFQYSPNPASEILKINFVLKEMSSTKIELVNIYGSVLHETFGFKSVGKQEYLIYTKNYSPGLYLLNLIVKNQKISRKIIINH